MNKAIFLDKDGTLIENIPYNCDISKVEFLPGVEKGLQLLQKNGFMLVVVSNQSGISKGYFSEKDFFSFIRMFRWKLENKGIFIHGFYFCPHDVNKKNIICGCRKPLPGLLFKAQIDLGIDCKDSWMIGDILHDIEAGNSAGCKSVFIDSGNETEWNYTKNRIPTLSSRDFIGAVSAILSFSKKGETVCHL